MQSGKRLRLNIIPTDPYFGFPLHKTGNDLEVYKSLKEKGYKCLSPYIGGKVAMEVLCPNGHKWHGHPRKITIPCNNCQTCWKEKDYTPADKTADVVASRKGLILSDYITDRTDMELSCHNGHKFISKPNHILSGTWCSFCAGNNISLAEKKFHDILTANGARALTPYINSTTKVDIICVNGHKYDQIPASTNVGIGCRYCAGNSVEQGETHFMNIVESKKGTILGKYENRSVIVAVKCENGHIFQAVPESIMRGRWCNKCSNRCPVQAKERFISTVTEHGGTVIGPYVRGHDKIEILCKQGHKFNMTPGHISGGKWCPACRNTCPIQALDRFKAVVDERKGIIRGNYVNTYTKVEVQCVKGHIFDTKPNNVTNGKWCRTCGLSESNGERIVREFLTQKNIPFQAEATFEWMPKKRYDYYFVYNGRHYIVEFDGIQHFVQIDFFCPDSETFDKRRQVDIDKTTNALKLGYYMIRIAYQDIDDISSIIDSFINNPDLPTRLFLSDPEEYTWLSQAIYSQ